LSCIFLCGTAIKGAGSTLSFILLVYVQLYPTHSLRSTRHTLLGLVLGCDGECRAHEPINVLTSFSASAMARVRTCRCGRPLSLCRATPSPWLCRRGTCAPDRGLPLPAARGSGVSAPTSSRARVRCNTSALPLFPLRLSAARRSSLRAHRCSSSYNCTYLCSLMPCPILQNPYVMRTPLPMRYTAGRKPRIGRLRLYWTGLYPPTGGISCGIVGGVVRRLNGC